MIPTNLWRPRFWHVYLDLYLGVQEELTATILTMQQFAYPTSLKSKFINKILIFPVRTDLL